ncbi:hypothetical protein F2Q69_00056335 [Brassica cretica]|uniref:non-specific serine/threonine protein kinase n=1 Tax=Brassica cretica TaxID=69181 RepID=A0A8S9N4C4_BRACR|nr:hypothetical protein F2Q69_00056335 [Brassica cretica]
MEEERRVVLFGKYEIGRLLGKGTFAKVYHAKHITTGESVAIKIINKDHVVKRPGMMDQIKREISIMRLVRHPNIVELKEVMATKTKIFFVMEFVRGGELFSKVVKGKLKEDAARRYFQQLISAVDFCHSRGVSHRDLKPENLLVDENGDLKVSDFGLSALPEQLLQDGLLHTQCGTPAYVAPEVLRKKGYDGAKADIWSCGVVLYVLLAGYLPFQEENLMNMYRKIFKAEFDFPPWFSPEARRLISKLLVVNPEKRISIPAITRTPWFRKTFKAPMIAAIESKRKVRSMFTSRWSAAEIVAKIEGIGKEIGMKVKRTKDFKVRMQGKTEGRKGQISVTAEVFEVAPEVAVVELCKSAGDTLEYNKLYEEQVRPALKDIVWSWHGDSNNNNNIIIDDSNINNYISDENSGSDCERI